MRENYYNVITINGTIPEELLKKYFNESDFRKEDPITSNVKYWNNSYHYVGSNSQLFGAHFWKVNYDENQIVIESMTEYKKKIYSFSKELFDSKPEYSNKKFGMEDRVGICIAGLYDFLNFLKENNIEYTIDIEEKELTDDLRNVSNVDTSSNQKDVKKSDMRGTVIFPIIAEIYLLFWGAGENHEIFALICGILILIALIIFFKYNKKVSYRIGYIIALLLDTFMIILFAIDKLLN